MKDSNTGSLYVFWFWKSLSEVLFNDSLFSKDACEDEAHTKETEVTTALPEKSWQNPINGT